MPTTNNHEVVVGLVLDGHFGWHNHARMIAVATDLGFELDVAGQRDVDFYDSGETNDNDSVTEIVMDIMDDAERWLNEHTDDGYVWHWSDGEFFLSPMCENGDCDDETCAHWCDS